MPDYLPPASSIQRLRDYGIDEHWMIEIVNEYGAIMDADAELGEIRDASRLLYPKQTILDALCEAYLGNDDADMRNAIVIGMAGLADYQAGVGQQPLWRTGLDLRGLSRTASNSEIDEFAARYRNAENGRKKFTHFELMVIDDRQAIAGFVTEMKKLLGAVDAITAPEKAAGDRLESFRKQASDGATILVDANVAGQLFRQNLLPPEVVRREVILRWAITFFIIAGFALLFFAPWYVAFGIMLFSLIPAGKAHRHGAEALLRESLKNPDVFDQAQTAGAFRIIDAPGDGQKRTREIPFHLSADEISRGFAP